MRDIEVCVFVFFIILTILVIPAGWWWKSEQCEARAVSFEQYDWGIIQGCMVKHNGKWLPLDNIRGFDDKG